MAGFLGEFIRGFVTALISLKRVQKANGELLDEPSPVPEGTSAIEVISTPESTPVIRIVSRKSG
jgi:hypothetical protein